jgi:DNA polymerase III subunit gamma/tau
MSQKQYEVIARKYRPKQFSDVTAQEHITRTLQNAIRTGRVAHGYIFTGSRGVGKTTSARIFAKALNCEKILTDEKYRAETAEPCGVCESCRDFDNNASLNVYEFDAASNNGVDDVRQLRENVRYAPQKGKYKVYIIDEFHMLSSGAFNAFLKTLEEPPPHVIFIFATTEIHKVPSTISSRCQRFVFKQISIPDIAETLAAICTKEAIDIDADSLNLIARKADGAMRDAQSLLDQVISFSMQDGAGQITYALTSNLLNILDDEEFFKVTDAMMNKDGAAMFDLSRFIYENGYDASYFLQRLVEHLRNLLIVKNVRSSKLIPVTDALKKRYEKTAETFTPAALMTAVEVITHTIEHIRNFREPQLRLELCLLKLIDVAQLSGDYAERLQTIEQTISELREEVKKKPLAKV